MRCDRIAHKAEIENGVEVGIWIPDAPLETHRPHQIGVLAGDADRLAALRVDGGDDLFVDGAGEHHLDHLDRLPVGDTQAPLEFRLDVQPLEQGADLRTAAMHHDRVHASLLD
jgi:hypothetical protein